MREAFINTLIKEAKRNKNIYLLTGDLGYSFLEKFQKKFSDRFINCGVAEQNMMGLATGLALSGKTVIVYSIIPFITFRVLEQIRNDICYHNLDVKIVGIGGGFSYGSQGYTHFGLEDIGIMSTLPNMKIFCPCDLIETQIAVEKMMRIRGPVYLRLDKDSDNLHAKIFKFKIGKGFILREGKNLTIIGIGSILKEVLLAVNELERIKPYSIKVISMLSAKPIDKKLIIESALETKKIITVEEHFLKGGIGETIGKILIESEINIKFKSLYVPENIINIIGDQKFLRDKSGLSYKKIKNEILKIYDH